MTFLLISLFNIAASVLFVVALIFQYFKYEMINKDLKNQLNLSTNKKDITFDFEKDIQFLKSLIINKIVEIDELMFKIRTGTDKSYLIKAGEINEIVAKAADEIINELSEEYKELLLKYFNKKKLIHFIVKWVNYEILSLSLKINKTQIDKYSKRKKNNNVNGL